jgi:hypothetical protein
MKLIAILLLATVATSSICYAEVTKLTSDTRRALEDAGRFHEIRTTTNLPSQVVSICADGEGRIAEPGQKWEPGDVIWDKTLPQKRLIWAAADGDLYVVHYESGGRGHGYHILVATHRRGDKKATIIWHGVLAKPLKDYAAFLEALERNELDDRLPYYL